MKISLSWLKEFVDYRLSAQELADLLSLRSIGVKQITDAYLELDLTYNRGDLLSIKGAAREVAAITNSSLNANQNEKFESPKDLPGISVEVEDKKLCPVYCVARIEGLKVGPSISEWVKRLTDSGMRSVNNITDVTNLVMLKFGQPMHAFDARGVKDETIIVRTAKKGERITTLDGKTRDLDTSDLLITDPLNALGIAGVMGGKDCEVTDTTTTILLEAAIFDPVTIRNTSKKHGLYSEAAKRFIHGLSKTNLLQALADAIRMYEQLGGKLTGFTAVGDLEDETKVVELTQKKLNSLLGVEIPTEQIEAALKSLGFHLQDGSEGKFLAEVPYWRRDIATEEDLIEEVARIYGYDKIPIIPLAGDNPIKIDQSFYKLIDRVKSECKEAGLTEVSTYSFFSTNVLNNASYKDEDLIKIANPISAETELLRTHLWPNLLEVAVKNIRKGYKDLAIFELGKVYYPKKEELPEENYVLSILFINGTDNPSRELFAILQNLNFAADLGEKIGESKGRFHPNRYMYLTKKGVVVGKIGEIHPRIVNKFGIEQRIAVVELSLEKFA